MSILTLYKSLTMKWQVLILTLSITFIIVGSLLGLVYFTNQIALSLFIESSNQIYYKTSQSNMNSRLQQYKQLINSVLDINGNQLITLHRLYNKLMQQAVQQQDIVFNTNMNMNYSGTQPIPEIIRIVDGYGKFDISYSFLCYSNLTILQLGSLSQQQQYGIKIQEELQAIGQIIYQGELTKQSFDYGFTVQDRLFFNYPCLHRGDTVFDYIPETRQFFIDSMDIYNNSNKTEYIYKLTKPYLLYTQKILGLSLTMPMMNEQQQFIGALGTNIYGSEFSKFIKQSDDEFTMLILVDEQGEIIIHNYNVTIDQLPFYIYTDTITGFNVDDWNQIKSGNGESNCGNIPLRYDRLCRYNSIFNSNLLIESIKLEKYQLYLILFHANTSFKEFQEEFNARIQHFFYHYNLNIINDNVRMMAFLILFIWIAIIIIVRPLYWVIDKSRLDVASRHTLFIRSSNQLLFCTSTTLQQLQESLMLVFKRIDCIASKKSDECVMIETLHYPIKVFNTNGVFNKCITNVKRLGSNGKRVIMTSIIGVGGIIRTNWNIIISHNMFNQINALIMKNLLVSVRSGEFLMESIIPMIVAIMMALKYQLSTLNQIIPIVYSLAIASTSRSVMIRLVDEKSKRYKETQKIMGMNRWSYTIGWMMTGYIRMLMSIAIFECSQLLFNYLFRLDWDFFYRDRFSNLVWPYILYGLTAINQSFLFASLFNDTKLAGEVSTFFCVGCCFFIFFTFVEAAASSLTFYVVIGLFSPQCTVAFGYVASQTVGINRLGCKIPIVNPFIEVPMNLFPVDLINETYDLNQSGIQLGCLFILYLLLFLYCDQVMPNEYGISKSPLFIFDIFKYSNKQDNQDGLLCQDMSGDISSAQYHENGNDVYGKPTIIIDNLNKQYGDNMVVNNITLRLYEQQIFCLLGHNGAGKTTTINLLTGMINKTSGKVYMYDHDLDNDLDQMRYSIGLCTQKDCLYDELTVVEHLQFIAGIKGILNINKQIDDLLITIELESERNTLIKVLSGGSKRKLSLGMALMGQSRIIFLDEPTSGMDAFSRRAIWKILDKIKKHNITIILTTHHLDEADILADRIGIMSKGRLLAVGSSTFIKHKFGEGYTLSLRGDNIDDKVVSRHISECTLVDEQSNEHIRTFQIPFNQSNKLKDVFETIQDTQIKVDLQMNTLEDAFVRIGKEEHQQNYTSQDLNMGSNVEFIPECLRQPPKYIFYNQCVAMFNRRLYTTIRTPTNVIAFIMPIITFVLGLIISNYVQFSEKVQNNYEELIIIKIAILGCVGVIGFSFNSTLYITLPVMEQEITLRQVLRGTGLRNISYWLGTFAFDFIIYNILTLCYFVTALSLQMEAVTAYWWQTLLLFMCFGGTYLPFTYFCSFFYDSVEEALRLFVIFIFFVTFCVPFMILGILNFIYQLNTNIVLKIIIYIFEIAMMLMSPFYNYYMGYMCIPGFTQVLQYSFGGLPIITTELYIYLIMLLIQCMIFIYFIYYLDLDKLTTQSMEQYTIPQYIVGDVKNEAQRILDKPCFDAIQAKVLMKKYQVDGPVVLNQVTFGVSQGQIMGIIGPNGAGKSTLMNIFAGLIKTTTGVAYVNRENVSNHNATINQHIGICTQYDCIWDNLTSQEHLRLFGQMKGLCGNQVEEAVDYFINTMELHNFRNTQAGNLSGGNKRKLCVANALIGGSDITFFDEPSTGVDPISRRSLFNTLKANVGLRNCSVIMTTHTIEEAENLSDKLGILIRGQFVCLDSPQQLRERYSNGYQLSIKCNPNTNNNQIVQIILGQYQQCQLLEDNRSNIIVFRIPSTLFNFCKCYCLLHQLQQQGLIIDFSLNESSLESIFIHFSKVQQEQNIKDGMAIL